MELTWKCPSCGRQTTTPGLLQGFLYCQQCTRNFGSIYMRQTGIVFNCGNFSIRVATDEIERLRQLCQQGDHRWESRTASREAAAHRTGSPGRLTAAAPRRAPAPAADPDRKDPASEHPGAR